MNILFCLLYWGFVGIIAMILFPVAVLIRVLTGPFDPKLLLLHRFTCWWARLYLHILPGSRIRVEGIEKISPNVGYILAANHQSFTDIMALSAVRVPFKWVSKKEAFRIPCIGWNMSLNGYISVDRGNIRSLRPTMEACKRELMRGVSLMMFPEGHRSPDGEIHTFHPGTFKLAADCGCAVIPIVVQGTFGIYGWLRVKAFPGLITIRILDPITIAKAGGTVDQLSKRVREVMVKALAEIRRPAKPPVQN